MPPFTSILQPRLLPFASLLLVGCVSERRGEFIPVPPQMPTVLAASPTLPAEPAEHDVLQDTLREARAGQWDAASTSLRRLSNLVQRGRVGAKAVDTLAAEDPARATRLALQLPRDPGWVGALDRATRQLTRRDPSGALAWSISGLEPSAAQPAQRAVVDESVALDPTATIERIQALPAGAPRDDLLVLAVASWARRELDRAVSWVRSRPDDALRRRLISSVAFEIAQTQPKRSLDLADLLPEGRDRWLLTSAIAQTWVAVDTPAALSWARQLPAGAARDAALAGVDTGLGVPMARRRGGAPGTNTGTRTRGGGAASDPGQVGSSPAFAAWLATQPTGLSRDDAILEYVRQRGATEPAAVGSLLQSLPGGPTRDRAMEVYVENLLISSPTEAVRWVQQLPQTERSHEMLEKTARRWLQTNPDAAAAWLETTLLPDYKKQELLREAGR